MLFDKIKELILTKEGRKEILQYYKEAFDFVDKLTEEFKMSVVNHDPHELDDKLQQATGYYTYLLAIYKPLKVLLEYKEQELIIKNRLKIIENNGKINNSELKKEARHELFEQLEILTLVEAYIDRVDQMIITCQSLRKKVQTEWNRQ